MQYLPVHDSIVKRHNSVLVDKHLISLSHILLLTIVKTNREEFRPVPWSEDEEDGDDDEKVIILLQHFLPRVKGLA